MIEVLVAYLEERGFKVDVRKEGLIIYKYAGDELFSIGWAPFEIDRMDKETLFFLADLKIEELNRDIIERVQSIVDGMHT